MKSSSKMIAQLARDAGSVATSIQKPRRQGADTPLHPRTDHERAVQAFLAKHDKGGKKSKKKRRKDDGRKN